jgi:cell division inhibitor SepF
MEELELQDKPGILSKLSGLFGRGQEDEEEETSTDPHAGNGVYQLRSAYRYHVSIRRNIVNFDDAYAAANGLKRSEQQVLNLAHTDPVLRQKIVDFMAGVAFAQEANWEEIGEHIYLVAPASAYVEVVPGEGPAPQKYSGSFFSN